MTSYDIRYPFFILFVIFNICWLILFFVPGKDLQDLLADADPALLAGLGDMEATLCLSAQLPSTGVICYICFLKGPQRARGTV